MAERTKTYLGDGVYCRAEDERITIFLSDGIDESNEIILEQLVFDELCAFVDRNRDDVLFWSIS